MYILSLHVLINVDPKFYRAKSNLGIVDMLDCDILDIYNENQKMMDVDMLNILHDESL